MPLLLFIYSILYHWLSFLFHMYHFLLKVFVPYHTFIRFFRQSSFYLFYRVCSSFYKNKENKLHLRSIFIHDRQTKKGQPAWRTFLLASHVTNSSLAAVKPFYIAYSSVSFLLSIRNVPLLPSLLFENNAFFPLHAHPNRGGVKIQYFHLRL